MQKFNVTTPILLQSPIDRLHKFWPLLDLRAELDLRWTNNIDIPLRCIAPVHRAVSGIFTLYPGPPFSTFYSLYPLWPWGISQDYPGPNSIHLEDDSISKTAFKIT